MDQVAIIPVDAFTIQHDPAIGALLAEYANESRIEDLPVPNPQWATYRALERTGALQCFAAYVGDTMVGFLGVVVSNNPHYGRLLAVVESYFVASAYRGSGAGLRLLKLAEEYARQRDAEGLLLSAPEGGRLADVLPGRGYRPTNRVFFKGT